MIVTRRDAVTGKVSEVQLTTLEHAVVRAYDKLLDMGHSPSDALSRLSLRSSLTPNFVRWLTTSDVRELESV